MYKKQYGEYAYWYLGVKGQQTNQRLKYNYKKLIPRLYSYM